MTLVNEWSPMQNSVNYRRHFKNNIMLIILGYLSLLKKKKRKMTMIAPKSCNEVKTHVPQPAVTLPEEECYWCVASEGEKWGQDLKHLNTTSGKTNDEGKWEKVAQSCLEKTVQGNVLLQQPALVTHNPKGEITIASSPQAVMSMWSTCMHVRMLTHSYAYRMCRKCTCLR